MFWGTQYPMRKGIRDSAIAVNLQIEHLNQNKGKSYALNYFDFYYFVEPWPLFCILISYAVGRSPWRGDQPFAMSLLTYSKHKHRINKERHPHLYWDSNQRPQCLSWRREYMS